MNISEKLYEKIKKDKEAIIEINRYPIYLSEDKFYEYYDEEILNPIEWEGYLLEACKPVLSFLLKEEYDYLENLDKSELLYMIYDNAFYDLGIWLVDYLDSIDTIIKKFNLKFEVIK